LEEKAPEPELLPSALKDVAEALGEVNISKEEAILHQQKLEVVLSYPGSYGIYSLVDWLDALGLKLTVSVK
jgi:DNA-binding phage protein